MGTVPIPRTVPTSFWGKTYLGAKMGRITRRLAMAGPLRAGWLRQDSPTLLLRFTGP